MLGQGGEDDLADGGHFIKFLCMLHGFIPPVLDYFLRMVLYQNPFACYL